MDNNSIFIEPIKIEKVEKLNDDSSSSFEAHCYDIEVDHPDHLFILSNGIISHTSSKQTSVAFPERKSITDLPYILK